MSFTLSKRNRHGLHSHIHTNNEYTQCYLLKNIPLPRLLHTAIPVRLPKIQELNQRDKPQGDRDTGPQTPQSPVKPKSSTETNWHRDHVVAEQLYIPAKVLSAQTPEDTVAKCGESVEELERCAQREHSGGEADDCLVGGEEVGDVVLQRAEERDVEEECRGGAAEE